MGDNQNINCRKLKKYARVMISRAIWLIYKLNKENINDSINSELNQKGH